MIGLDALEPIPLQQPRIGEPRRVRKDDLVLAPSLILEDVLEDAEEDGLYRSMPGEKRTLQELPSKMVVVDRQVVLVSISKSESSSARWVSPSRKAR